MYLDKDGMMKLSSQYTEDLISNRFFFLQSINLFQVLEALKLLGNVDTQNSTNSHESK